MRIMRRVVVGENSLSLDLSGVTWSGAKWEIILGGGPIMSGCCVGVNKVGYLGGNVVCSICR